MLTFSKRVNLYFDWLTGTGQRVAGSRQRLAGIGYQVSSWSCSCERYFQISPFLGQTWGGWSMPVSFFLAPNRGHCVICDVLAAACCCCSRCWGNTFITLSTSRLAIGICYKFFCLIIYLVIHFDFIKRSTSNS